MLGAWKESVNFGAHLLGLELVVSPPVHLDKHEARNQVAGPASQARGPENLKPGIRNLKPGSRNLQPEP